MTPGRRRSTGRVGRTTLRRHIRRAAGRDPCPPTRPADVQRSRLVVALTAALLVAFVPALLAALAVLRAGESEARYEEQHRHRITASTVAEAVEDEADAMGVFHAQAVWEFPAAVHGAGTVEVPPDTGVGATVGLWVDDRGKPVAPPRPGTEIATSAALSGAGAMAALSGAAVTGYALGCRVINRRTAAAWEQEWEAVEPEWSGRPRHSGTGDQ
ncbi:hypothetical protein [Kitasatospora sp. NPDC057223]|uniref:Rv1733c family protein n=1 Tax=Kitasatospora sp. NPDC057223 TaxID=3346055 RepID=UPI0036346A12